MKIKLFSKGKKTREALEKTDKIDNAESAAMSGLLYGTAGNVIAGKKGALIGGTLGAVGGYTASKRKHDYRDSTKFRSKNKVDEPDTKKIPTGKKILGLGLGTIAGYNIGKGTKGVKILKKTAEELQKRGLPPQAFAAILKNPKYNEAFGKTVKKAGKKGALVGAGIMAGSYALDNYKKNLRKKAYLGDKKNDTNSGKRKSGE